MKRAIPITTLLLGIGGVLLTSGWDHEVLTRFPKADIDTDALTTRLQNEGARSFLKSSTEQTACIGARSEALQ